MTNHASCAHVMRGAACSPRERSARRAARDVSQRLVVPFVLLQMVVSFVFPCGAFALTPNDQGVLWGPTTLGGGNSGIVVSATNNFDAALWAIGRWNTKIQLDNPKFAMLSNADTGGHFYELASCFHSYAEVGTPNWPNAAAVEGYAISFGSANVWLATVPDGLIADARNDYNTVLNGGSLGGGSGGGSDDDVLTFEGGTYYRTGYTNAFIEDGVVAYYNTSSSKFNNDSIPKLSSSLTLQLNRSFAPNFFDLYDSYSYDLFALVYNNGSGTALSVTIYAVPLGIAQIVEGTNTVYGSNEYISRIKLSDSGAVSYYVSPQVSVGSSYTCSGGLIVVSDNISTTSSGTTAGALAILPNTGILLSGGIHQGPTLPPNNWPTDEPTPTPDPPDVPGPSDDPIPQPDPPDLPDPREYPVTDPYTPDPDPPTNPVITYDPNPTGDATDYRPWLNAILVLLRKINTTISDGFGDLRGWLTNHCDHIREQIHDDTVDLGVHVQTAIHNGFVSFERWLQGTFVGYFIDELDYVIGQQFDELESYLHSLFRWLASQFDFTFGGTSYDDSSVLYWLRRIYARLGGGAPNPGSDGTVDEGFDWWAWLLGLITDALGGIITDFVGDVGGFLATLADVFPFSIPGDIVAYLTLLDAARETPRFVVTVPAIEGWWQSFDYEIDLEPFDDAMGVVRGMYLIYWGLILVMKTDWLGGVFDFATRAVVQFFDKITGGAYSA